MEADIDYLKSYVRQHPDNKMGWYLLGKQYAAQGEEGKANYCFAQAGEVYEAFEKKANDLAVPHRTQAHQRVPYRLVRRWLVALLMLGLLLVPVAGPPSNRQPSAVLPAVPDDDVAVYYSSPLYDPRAVEHAAARIVLSKHVAYGVVAKAPLSPDGRLVEWAKRPALLMEVERRKDSAQLAVNYLDAASCDCMPGDAAKATAAVQAWMSGKEQEAVLRSAAVQYRQRTGADPQTIDELVRDYPNNSLAGYTEYMKKVFAARYAVNTEPAAGGGQPAGGDALPLSADDGLPAAAESSDPLTDTLSIVVDVTTHQLALMSGVTVLRSYPVGLGGDKTPQGEFTVTEKVKNPNGRADGEFGSRGMTLSDSLYAIHGTNQPRSIGKDLSHGCIRMLQEHIEELFDLTPLGTKVVIGTGSLPAGLVQGDGGFRLPVHSKETNPNKTYHWLD